MPPAKDPGPTGAPVEWHLTRDSGRPTEEKRTYVQSELTIEGEARLLGIATEIGSILHEKDFDFSRLSGLIDNPDWPTINSILAILQEHSAKIVADSACIFLGIYPTQINGQPNPEYEDHHTYLLRSLNFAKWSDMVRVFVDQNDYQRLAAPFWERVQQRPEWQAQERLPEAPIEPSPG